MLMVAYVFPPIAYVGTYRTIRFCRYLPENGWIPHVLTIEETSDLDNDYGLLDRLPEEIKIYRTKTIDFWRIWKKREAGKTPVGSSKKDSARNIEKAIITDHPSLFQKLKQKMKDFIWALLTTPDHMVFWLPFAVLRGIKIMREEKCDVIYTTSPPHSEQVIGYFIAKIFRKKWVADFRDPMLDSSGYSPSRFRYFVDSFLEKLVVRNADKIIIISQDYLEKMKVRYSWATNKFLVLPNGYDPDIYATAPVEIFDKFTIIYAGTFYANRKPDFFLRGLHDWLAGRPEIRNQVQVKFFGMESSEANQIIETLQLQDVVQVIGLIPQDELIPKQKGADLLLLIIGFDPESRGTVTSKVFEYMACDRPILAIIPDGDAANILENYDKLLRVGKEDSILLVDSLDSAYNDYLKKRHQNKSHSASGHIAPKNPYDARLQAKMLTSIWSDDRLI